MKERKAYHIHLEGDNFQVGTKLGELAQKIPGLALLQKTPTPIFSKEEAKKVYQLFDQFCPGINEEIAGFADSLHIPTNQILYYLLTYLKPGCSQVALLPSKTTNNHTLLARNYEFSEEFEELTLYTTKITGKYAHIGCSLLMFGREEGMNELGLGVSLTSAGQPVGNMEFSRKPAITGLQFWAVIRSLLENCQDVDQAIYLAQEMPIAYNINLMVADKKGQAALLESFDGKKAWKKIDSAEPFICSTNHVHLPELKEYDPKGMKNSFVRYELINQTLKEKEKVSKEDLKKLLSSKYPQGLCCHYYDEFFGTLHSMIFDLNEGTVEVCFGSPAINQWYTCSLDGPFHPREYLVQMEREKAPLKFFQII